MTRSVFVGLGALVGSSIGMAVGLLEDPSSAAMLSLVGTCAGMFVGVVLAARTGRASAALERRGRRDRRGRIEQGRRYR